MKVLTDELHGTETTRTKQITDLVTELVDNLVEIAHEHPDAIERRMHTHVKEMNVHVLRNNASVDELIASLTINEMRRRAATRADWETKKNQWRKLRYARTLIDYENTLGAVEFQRPQARLDLRDKLIVEQTKLRDTLFAKLDIVLRMCPPHSVPEEVKTLSQEIQDFYSQADQDCDEVLCALEAQEEQLHSRAVDLIEELKNKLRAIGEHSEEDMEAEVAQRCVGPESARHDKVTEMLALARKTHEDEETELIRNIDAICRYYLGLANIWYDINRLYHEENENAHERIAVRHDTYDDEIRNLNNDVEAQLHQLNEEPTPDKLEERWVEVVKFVGPGGNIEKAHR